MFKVYINSIMFRLTILWNDYHNKFGWQPSSCIDTIKKKKKSFLAMRAVRICSPWFRTLHSAVFTVHTIGVYYNPSAYCSYAWKCVPSGHL